MVTDKQQSPWIFLVRASFIQSAHSLMNGENFRFHTETDAVKKIRPLFGSTCSLSKFTLLYDKRNGCGSKINLQYLIFLTTDTFVDLRMLD